MLKFNKNLAIVHSYLCADGYVIRNPPHQKNIYYYIGLRNTCDTLLEDFEKNFYEYFKIMPRRCKDGRSVVQNKATYYLLTEDFSYYSREWTLPELDKENLSFWLRTFFDCEGWVYCKKAKSRLIGLDSVNHKGLEDVQKALKRFDIDSIINIPKNRDTHRLHIYGKENLIRFEKEIGFLHPNKKAKLRDAIETFVEYEWTFPEENLEEFIINLMKEKSRFGKIRKNDSIKLCSIKEINFIRLSNYLSDLFNIESKVYRNENKHSIYYTLSIQKKAEVEKAVRLFGLRKTKLDLKIRKDYGNCCP
jgi:hypothetical protein